MTYTQARHYWEELTLLELFDWYKRRQGKTSFCGFPCKGFKQWLIEETKESVYTEQHDI